MPGHPDLITNVKRFQTAAFTGTGLDPTLPPPATEEELAAAAQDLGYELPAELKTLYRFCGGGLPLGSNHWITPGGLGEETATQRDGFQDHYEFLEKLGPLSEGPQDHKIVCIQVAAGQLVVVEAEEEGVAGRVWGYDAHAVDDPFTLLAASFGEYWANLADLAEAGWYRAKIRRGLPDGTPRVETTDDASRGVPKYRAALAKLGLGHIVSYP